MNKFTLIICIWLTMLSSISIAQDKTKMYDSGIEKDNKCPTQEKIQSIIHSSDKFKSLNEALSTVDRKVKLESLQAVVSAGDKTVIPLLEMRVQCNFGPTHHLDIALVSLGETQYFDKAIQELESEKNTTVYYAIWKLARFKTKAAYQKLYELLDDESIREKHRAGADGSPGSISRYTKKHLFNTVENPPKDQYSTEAWKEWFSNNHLVD